MLVPLTPLSFEQRAVQLYGSKVGVVDGDKRFTYSEFGERVSRLANAIRGLGIEAGERVAVLCLNCHQLLEAYYGVLAAGAVLLPLNVRLAPDELAFILEHSEASVVLFDAELGSVVRALLDRAPTVWQTIVMEGNAPGAIEAHQYETLLAQASPERPVLDIDENSMAELFYTSGSTGRPKGVMLTHRSLYLHAMNILAELFHYGDEDVALHVVPLFHVNGWGTPHYLTAVGGTHVMMRKFQPQEVLRLIEHEGVTRLAGVPAMMKALLACPDVRQRDLRSLKGITMGGAPTPLSLLREVEAAFGCRVLCGYGLTETSPVVTSAQPKSHVSETEEHRVRRQASAGRPLPGVELRVVTRHGKDVPPDDTSVGEVAIRSNVVMDGYFRDPEGTAAAIRDGWFYTGDLATVNAEGYITIVDRLKDIIISGGENIASVEVENVLSAHPSVFECAVIAVPDDHWGEVPLALVSLRPGQTAVPEELEAHCRERLASFKVPKRWEFREELPKGGTGKILKRQLREPYWPNQPQRAN